MITRPRAASLKKILEFENRIQNMRGKWEWNEAVRVACSRVFRFIFVFKKKDFPKKLETRGVMSHAAAKSCQRIMFANHEAGNQYEMCYRRRPIHHWSLKILSMPMLGRTLSIETFRTISPRQRQQHLGERPSASKFSLRHSRFYFTFSLYAKEIHKGRKTFKYRIYRIISICIMPNSFKVI